VLLTLRVGDGLAHVEQSVQIGEPRLLLRITTITAAAATTTTAAAAAAAAAAGAFAGGRAAYTIQGSVVLLHASRGPGFLLLDHICTGRAALLLNGTLNGTRRPVGVKNDAHHLLLGHGDLKCETGKV